MITIFNGRERKLGGSTTNIFAQINVEFRQHLHHLKGAPLGVFLAISLHANANGWAWPTRELLARETGYGVQTISIALARLCEIEINGQRLLLKYQPRTGIAGTWESNNYLIFPSPTEVRAYGKGAQMELLLPPCTGFPYTADPSTVQPSTVQPATVQPATEKPYTKENHLKGEPKDKEETEEKPDTAPLLGFCLIHGVQMKLWEKAGDSWYSHQLDDGNWCKGNGRSPITEIDVFPCACGLYIIKSEACDHGCYHCCTECWEPQVSREPIE